MSAIERIDISESQVQKVLSLNEGHFVDVKAIEIGPAKLSKAIAAFANAEGGELFIGIDDNPRKWRGFSDEEAANSHIQVFEELFPLGSDFRYEFLVSEKT